MSSKNIETNTMEQPQQSSAQPSVPITPTQDATATVSNEPSTATPQGSTTGPRIQVIVPEDSEQNSSELIRDLMTQISSHQTQLRLQNDRIQQLSNEMSVLQNEAKHLSEKYEKIQSVLSKLPDDISSRIINPDGNHDPKPPLTPNKIVSDGIPPLDNSRKRTYSAAIDSDANAELKPIPEDDETMAPSHLLSQSWPRNHDKWTRNSSIDVTPQRSPLSAPPIRAHHPFRASSPDIRLNPTTSPFQSANFQRHPPPSNSIPDHSSWITYPYQSIPPPHHQSPPHPQNWHYPPPDNMSPPNGGHPMYGPPTGSPYHPPPPPMPYGNPSAPPSHPNHNPHYSIHPAFPHPPASHHSQPGFSGAPSDSVPSGYNQTSQQLEPPNKSNKRGSVVGASPSRVQDTRLKTSSNSTSGDKRQSNTSNSAAPSEIPSESLPPPESRDKIIKQWGDKIAGLELSWFPNEKRWVPLYSFQDTPDVSFKDVYNEYNFGLNGLISIQELDYHYGTQWRIAKQKNEYSRRRKLARYIRKLGDRHGIDKVCDEISSLFREQNKSPSLRIFGDLLVYQGSDVVLDIERFKVRFPNYSGILLW